MKEIVLNNKKNGMAMLLLIVLLYLAGVAAMVVGGIFGMDRGHGWGVALFVLGVVGLVLYFRSLPARKADPAPEKKDPPQSAEPTEDTEDDDVPVFTGDML